MLLLLVPLLSFSASGFSFAAAFTCALLLLLLSFFFCFLRNLWRMHIGTSPSTWRNLSPASCQHARVSVCPRLFPSPFHLDLCVTFTSPWRLIVIPSPSTFRSHNSTAHKCCDELFVIHYSVDSSTLASPSTDTCFVILFILICTNGMLCLCVNATFEVAQSFLVKSSASMACDSLSSSVIGLPGQLIWICSWTIDLNLFHRHSHRNCYFFLVQPYRRGNLLPQLFSGSDLLVSCGIPHHFHLVSFVVCIFQHGHPFSIVAIFDPSSLSSFIFHLSYSFIDILEKHQLSPFLCGPFRVITELCITKFANFTVFVVTYLSSPDAADGSFHLLSSQSAISTSSRQLFHH